MLDFTFGFGEYFSFSFRLGPKPCTCNCDRSDKGVSQRSNESLIKPTAFKPLRKPPPLFTNSDDRDRLSAERPAKRKRGENRKELVTVSTHTDKPPPRCIFLEIPVEIRIMIYKLLLISATLIKDAHKLIGPQKSVLVNHCPTIQDIDSAILRTCHLVYQESLPILYKGNKFAFDKLKAIKDFARYELPEPHAFKHLFGLQPAPYGRLTMLRCVALKLGPAYDYSSEVVDRESLWRDWHDLFSPTTASGFSLAIGFPALETLYLDFTDWRLDADKTSELQVSLHRPSCRHLYMHTWACLYIALPVLLEYRAENECYRHAIISANMVFVSGQAVCAEAPRSERTVVFDNKRCHA